MSTPHKFMTHAERAARRGAIKIALRGGGKTARVAADHGVSIAYIREIARGCGVALRPGRPPLVGCAELRLDYYRLRREVGAPVARQIMGLPL